MFSTTVRISVAAIKTLRQIAERSGESMPVILDKAIEDYRRRMFLEEANAAYASLAKDPGAWVAWQKEQGAWETTLADGLEPYEVSAKPRKARRRRRRS